MENAFLMKVWDISENCVYYFQTEGREVFKRFESTVFVKNQELYCPTNAHKL